MLYCCSLNWTDVYPEKEEDNEQYSQVDKDEVLYDNKENVNNNNEYKNSLPSQKRPDLVSKKKRCWPVALILAG